ncbi:MAG: iron-sulfur cluster repair di-iron protein [Pyrinomonadaceae bacterium]|nr:iron-sulfur cluster repair di-iron protein [Pyrinomonadaceae bacterium]
MLTKTVREIALESPATVRVFEEFKIDYCCGGSKSLEEACRIADADEAGVTSRLEAVLDSENGSEAEPPADPVELIAHIVQKHHTYTRNEIERLSPLLKKVCEKHGQAHEELFVIRDHFHALALDLGPHLMREEQVLFPYIEKLARSVQTGENRPFAPFGEVRNPIRMMSFEHETAGSILKDMRKASKEYKPPAGACPSYTALYFGLEELERDLHRHIHLENNLLFPLAIEMESGA